MKPGIFLINLTATWMLWRSNHIGRCAFREALMPPESINAHKVQVEYFAARKETPVIKFLEQPATA